MRSIPLPRILLVEDDDGLRRTLVRVLTGTYDVVQAPNGAEAIRLLSEGEFDAVITDLEMPEVGGDGVIAWLERNRPEVAARAVVMTGGAKAAAQAAWLRAFDTRRVVHKPYRVADLVAVLERAVRGAR